MVDAQLLLRALLLSPVDESAEKLGEVGLRQELDENVAQLALGREVVDVVLVVENPVAEPHEIDREVFALTVVVTALPR